MAIDRFNKEQFEASLPVNKTTKEKLWEYVRFQGEHVYRIPVTASGVGILIWSSVEGNGLAGDTSCNSIRCYLVDRDNSPLSNKSQSYVTRVKGWDVRLKDILRVLWIMGKVIEAPCRCGSQKSIMWCKNGDNAGLRFIKCPKCGFLGWVDKPKKKESN